jgi:hypothetical protein
MKVGNFCPLIQKKCIENKCAWYIQVRGMNPNTGVEVDQWSCSVSWIPMLQVETSQQARQAGAAVESFRNEVVRSNVENQQLYLDFMKQVKDGYVLPANVTPLNNPINMLESNDTKE